MSSLARNVCQAVLLYKCRWLTFINCQVSRLDRSCYHLELYSIVSRCVLPLPAVRGSRTFARFSRLPAVMIWIAYDASCIIWKGFAKISYNSYYTRLHSDTCIHHVKPFTLPPWERGPLRICAGAGWPCRRGAVPGGTPTPRVAEKQTGVVLFILYIYFSQPQISKMT